MARNKKTSTTLRTAKRGASFTEYAVLTGLLGAVSIGAVLAVGISTRDNAEEIQAQVATVAQIANGSNLGDGGNGGSGGTGTGGGTTPTTPPVDVFASCETGYGPNPAAIRGNGDGSALMGGDNGQIFYAIANALVDGGEGGVDTDTLMVPGAGAIANFTSWQSPESGTVDLPGGGTIVFANIEEVVLCDAGGFATPPPPPPPSPVLFSWFKGANIQLTPSVGYSLLTNRDTEATATVMDIGSGQGTNSSTAVSANLQVVGTDPFVQTSALASVVGTHARNIGVSFTSPVENASFRIGSFNTSGVGATLARDTVRIVGIAEDGDIVFPTTSASFVSSDGLGTFQGHTTSCSGACSNALFTFEEPISQISIRHFNGPVSVSGGATTWAWRQVWISDVAGEVVE